MKGGMLSRVDFGLLATQCSLWDAAGLGCCLHCVPVSCDGEVTFTLVNNRTLGFFGIKRPVWLENMGHPLSSRL